LSVETLQLKIKTSESARFISKKDSRELRFQMRLSLFPPLFHIKVYR